MPAEAVLTGIDSSTFTPGNFLEINFAKGQAGGFQGQYSAILIANKLASGSGVLDTKVYGPDTDVPVGTEDEVIAIAGAGSEAHRMWRRFTAANKKTPLYMIFVTQSVGAQAALTVTFATTATANCTARFWCGDEYVDINIDSGDTAAAVVARAVPLINAKTHWPITVADSTGGVLTATAKQAGLRGNDIKIQANIFCSSGSPAMTVTRNTSTALAGGTTADSNTTALATLLAKRFRYVVSAANDATQFGAVKTQLNSKALPLSGITEYAIAGFSGSLANGITLSTGVNAARDEIIIQKNSDWTPAELAAQLAAAVSLFSAGRRPRPRHNFNGFGNSLETSSAWLLPAPRSGDGFTAAEVESALHNGLTPVGTNQNGTSFIIARSTTRSLNGAVQDYRIRYPHKVEILDFFADDVRAAANTAFDGKDIGDDPAPGAAPAAGDAQSNPDVVSPRVYKAFILDQIDLATENGQFDKVAAARMKANTTVGRSNNPSTRLWARIPAEPIDILDQTTTAIDQVR